MREIQLIIEGPGATVAAEELATEAAFDLTLQPTTDDATKSLEALYITAAIVGITVNAIQSADILYNWWQKWAAAQPATRLDKVIVITPNNRRLLLHNMTKAEIAAVIDDYCK